MCAQRGRGDAKLANLGASSHVEHFSDTTLAEPEDQDEADQDDQEDHQEQEVEVISRATLVC